MSGNIRIADLKSEQHYIHLAASGAPTFNFPVQFADEASEVFSAYRDRYGFGASAMKAGCGNIYDCRNRVVGRISYNGRIWDANGKPVEYAESNPCLDTAATVRHLLTPSHPSP
jgi:hypothetical protein